jgi:superfamily II DNA or RNA helicase
MNASARIRDSLPVPRVYQPPLIEGVRDAYRGGASSALLVSPTGSGKTFMFVSIVASAAAKAKRVLILGHRIEIVEQISAALDSFGVAHGLIAPEIPETDHAIQVASVASLIRRLARWAGRFDLIVVDEAHHAVAGSWAKIIAAMPGARVLGVTATPERLDGRGLGDVFEVMIEGPSVAELIEGGFLSRFVAYTPAETVDLSHARTRAGDYAVEDIAEAMGGVVVESAVLEYARLCAGSPAVAFCVDIAHSIEVAARFRAHGFRARHLDGATPGDERRRLIGALGDGGLDVLTNCGIVSEGVDVPALGAAILLRPTQSLALYLQQCGRALRPAEGKDRALILDFAGNSSRHGLPDEPRLWTLDSTRRNERRAPAPLRRCGECGAMNRINARTCCACGAELHAPVQRAEFAMRLEARERGAPAGVYVTIRNMSYPQRVRWAGVDTERLAMVARACGYHPGWIDHALRETREGVKCPF